MDLAGSSLAPSDGARDGPPAGSSRHSSERRRKPWRRRGRGVLCVVYPADSSVCERCFCCRRFFPPAWRQSTAFVGVTPGRGALKRPGSVAKSASPAGHAADDSVEPGVRLAWIVCPFVGGWSRSGEIPWPFSIRVPGAESVTLAGPFGCGHPSCACRTSRSGPKQREILIPLPIRLRLTIRGPALKPQIRNLKFPLPTANGAPHASPWTVRPGNSGGPSRRRRRLRK